MIKTSFLSYTFWPKSHSSSDESELSELLLSSLDEKYPWRMGLGVLNPPPKVLTLPAKCRFSTTAFWSLCRRSGPPFDGKGGQSGPSCRASRDCTSQGQGDTLRSRNPKKRLQSLLFTIFHFYKSFTVLLDCPLFLRFCPADFLLVHSKCHSLQP